MMVGDQTLLIVIASGVSLLQLQNAAEHCHDGGQYLRTTFLIACSEKKKERKKSNYSTHSTFGGRLDCFRYVYGLTTRLELTRAM